MTTTRRKDEHPRLADFILANIEPILAEWETFARSIWPSIATTDAEVLRDHAEQLLRAAAADMQSPQSSAQQSDKSRGIGDAGTQSDEVDRASISHGRERHNSGFDLAAVIAEYRALRASVVRLWRESVPQPDSHDLADLTRFSESIDQSLTEAVISYTKLVEQERRAAMDLQSALGDKVRKVNQALLISNVRQHELTEQADKDRETIARSERELSDFFETASIGLHWVGPDGMIMRANQAELDLLGYGHPGGREEYVGRHIAEFHVDQPVIEEMLARLFRGETLRDCPARLRCKDGSIRDVLINSSALFENGQFIHTRCFTHDITERKAAEEAIARLAAIVASSDDAIISNDLEGVITTWNRGAEHLFGYTAEEAIGQSVKMLMPDGRLEEMQEIIARIKRGKLVHHYETVRRRKDGVLLNISLTVSPLRDATGRIVGASKIGRDITERTRMEQKTRDQSAELADLHRRKDEFLAMLGHELRNPLAPITNALHLLRLQKGEDQVQQQARTIIERQVRQLSRLVDDLLEISRISTGRIHLHQERVALNGIVENAIETVSPLIRQHRHSLEASLSSEPIWLHADASRLEQVVVNLLTNAAKYTPDGGQILLSVWQEGDEGVLRVKDSGVGIAPELLPHIFDLFTQAERSLDRAQGGLGIGLSLVQRLVELHQGRVEAHSKMGEGSEFVVYLPVLQAPALPPAPVAAPATKSNGPSRRVLVVDDNIDAAQTLGMLLKVSGNEVRTVYNGPAALEAAAAFLPDVVLLDIGLPGLDGYEVAKRLREQPASQQAVLIAMTGYGQEAYLQRSLAAGFNHHLVKPVRFEKVQEILAGVLPKPA